MILPFEYALEHGMINVSDVQEQIKMNKRKELLEKHPYSIWEGSDGNWYTYVPDDTKKRGIALRKRGSESKINDFVVEYWQEREREEKERKKKEEEEKIKKETLFIDVYYMWRELHDQTVQENTIEKYDSDKRRFFDGNEFADKEIQSITLYDVELFFYQNIKKYQLQSEAFRKLYGYVFNTFCIAGQKNLISSNPLQFTKAKKYYPNCFSKSKPPEKKVVSESDMHSLQCRFQKDHEKKPDYIPTYAIEFASLTGMRVGEIAALRWDHIFDDYIFVEFSEKYNNKRTKYWIDAPKNKKTRTFPMTPEIRKLLDKVKAVEQEYGYYCEWVFANENGRIHAPMISSCSKNKCRQTGVNEDGEQGTRIFRRTLNSKLRCKGMSAIEAASMLGHSPQVNDKYYSYDVTGNTHKSKVLSEINAKTVLPDVLPSKDGS